MRAWFAPVLISRSSISRPRKTAARRRSERDAATPGMAEDRWAIASSRLIVDKGNRIASWIVESWSSSGMPSSLADHGGKATSIGK